MCGFKNVAGKLVFEVPLLSFELVGVLFSLRVVSEKGGQRQLSR